MNQRNNNGPGHSGRILIGGLWLLLSFVAGSVLYDMGLGLPLSIVGAAVGLPAFAVGFLTISWVVGRIIEFALIGIGGRE